MIFYSDDWTREMDEEYQKLETRIVNYSGFEPRLSVEEMNRYLHLDWVRSTQ